MLPWQNPRSPRSQEKMKILDPRSFKMLDPGFWGSWIPNLFGILAHVCIKSCKLVCLQHLTNAHSGFRVPKFTTCRLDAAVWMVIGHSTESYRQCHYNPMEAATEVFKCSSDVWHPKQTDYDGKSSMHTVNCMNRCQPRPHNAILW